MRSAEELWERVLALAEPKPSIFAAVRVLRLQALRAGVATLSADSPAGLSTARTRRQAIEDLLRQAAGAPVRIEFAEPSSAQEAAPAPELDAVAHAEAMKIPLVRRAMELFNARIVSVSPDDRRDPEP